MSINFNFFIFFNWNIWNYKQRIWSKKINFESEKYLMLISWLYDTAI